MKAFIVVLVFAPCIVFAQTSSVTLSPVHQKKLSSLTSGHDRIKKYHKYVSKENKTRLKQLDKKAKKESDSVQNVQRSSAFVKKQLLKKGICGDQQWAYADSIRSRIAILEKTISDTSATQESKQEAKKELRLITKNKVNSAISKGGFSNSKPYQIADSIKLQLRSLLKISRDSSESDSTRKSAREKVKFLVLEHAGNYEQFRGMVNHYGITDDLPNLEALESVVPGLDTMLSVFDSPQQLMHAAEKIGTERLENISEIKTLNSEAGKVDLLQSQMKSLTSKDGIKAEGKTAVQDQLGKETEGLNTAHQKMSALVSKYQSFNTADSLTSAVKRNSLEGKALKERLVIGGNFNVVSTDPISVDLSPLIGYKVKSNFSFGLAFNYRQTFADSLRFAWRVSPLNTSIRIFASVDVFKNFFAYTEVERAGLKAKSNESLSRHWNMNYFVGVGRKFLVHPKIFASVLALYKVNEENRENRSYPSRFQIRFGFQNSDLAFRKSKIYYKP